MQFLVLGYDGRDDQALERRLAVRGRHLAHGDDMRQRGELLYAAAILDDAGRMIGSAMILDMPSRGAIDAWLAEEPYVTGDVWRDITVRPCQVGPAFAAPDG